MESHPDGTLYHLACWKDVIEKTFGYTPLYHVLEDDHGSIKGALPLFLVHSLVSGDSLVSLPFSDYCNPLVASTEEFQCLVTEIVSSARGRSSSRLRFCLAGCGIDIEQNGFQLESGYKNHVLRIDRPIEEIRRSVIDASRRRNLNTAARSGVSIAYSDDDGDLEAYYRMYVLTRKKHGLVPIPFRFFRNVWASLAPRGMAWLVLARLHAHAIAGILLLRYKDTLICLSNASQEKYLAHRPNDLLWWEAVELASRQNLAYFDFGRTSTANQGLLSFKRKWGTEERDICHYVMPLSGRRHADRDALASSGMVQGILRRTPAFVLRLGGELAYRILG